jgi:hypothetical protein
VTFRHQCRIISPLAAIVLRTPISTNARRKLGVGLAGQLKGRASTRRAQLLDSPKNAPEMASAARRMVLYVFRKEGQRTNAYVMINANRETSESSWYPTKPPTTREAPEGIDTIPPNPSPPRDRQSWGAYESRGRHISGAAKHPEAIGPGKGPTRGKK